jgi:hypothetical protein
MIEHVEFEWDPKKAESNERKHGVTFSFALRVFQDPARLEFLDDGDYSEERWSTIGAAGDFILHVAYTLRGNIVRLISARRVTRNEFFCYWNGQIPS